MDSYIKKVDLNVDEIFVNYRGNCFINEGFIYGFIDMVKPLSVEDFLNAKDFKEIEQHL